MWRRVLSQSPSKAPDDAESARRTLQYLDGWKALGALLHSGHSLSGRERNCCFLNLGNSRFADAASAIGFDHPSDSRGIGVVDWDGDGDLDLWVANRTSPRARYLQNDIPDKNQFVAVKLRGVSCNRDAIGARVELVFKGEDKTRLVRSVTAGEGFISQSSKWVHFGVGNRSDIDRLIVQWPGGSAEEFRNVVVNKRYEIVQGRGETTVWNRTNPSRPFVSSTPHLPAATEARRTVLAHRTPMPEVEFYHLDGKKVLLSNFRSKPVLINLWASWCQPCVEELGKWKDAKQEFDRVSLTVLPVNVEHAEDGPLDHLAEISGAWHDLRTPFDCYATDASGYELFEIIDRIHFLHRASLPIPSSFLIDAEGNLAAVYKGPVSADQIVRDVEFLGQLNGDSREAAVPFRGKWYSDPYPPNLTAVPLQMNGLGRAGDAFDYIMRHVATTEQPDQIDAWRQLGVPTGKVLKLLHGTAKLLDQAGRVDDAVTLYEKALLYDQSSWDTRLQLSSLLIRLGRSKAALAVSQEMTKLNQDHPLPWNNIAWILATSKDPAFRDATKAVELAERVCKATEYQEPTALDTLAVAYAAAGRFEEARVTARKAMDLAASLGIPTLTETIRGRLQLYEKDRPYVPSVGKPHNF